MLAEKNAVVIDADNCIVGRLASIVAKELVKGNEIHVINAEKAVISGGRQHIIKIYKEKVERGDPYHGPFYPKNPERILKRTIRGMIPRRKPRGMEAFRRLKVYISVPEEFAGIEPKKIKEAENKLEHDYITLGELSSILGSKWKKK